MAVNILFVDEKLDQFLYQGIDLVVKTAANYFFTAQCIIFSTKLTVNFPCIDFKKQMKR